MSIVKKFKDVLHFITRLRLVGLLTVLGSLACDIVMIVAGVYLVFQLGMIIVYHFVFDNMIGIVSLGEVEQGEIVDIAFKYNNDLPNRRISLTLTRLIEYSGEWDFVKNWDHAAQMDRDIYVSNWWTAEETGYYRAHAEFYDLMEDRDWGRHASTVHFAVVEETGAAKPYELRIWCGHEIKGNPDEQLNARFAHQIAVEIIDKATGQPPTQTYIPVTFTTYLYPQQIQVGALIPVVSHTTVVDGEDVELAYTNPHVGIILSTQLPEAGSYQLHEVVAHCDSTDEDVYFLVYSINDAENSHLPGDTTHQTGYQSGQWIEVPGDNYLDDGEPTDYKDVKIELDYYLWSGAAYNVNQVAAFIETVLVTAGIHAEVIVDSQIPEAEMTNPPNRQERMALLSRHKDPVEPFTNYDRRWNNSIHVILGTECGQDTMGIAEMYPESGIFNKWFTMHRGSGDISFSAPFLDSVGCFVFAKRIQEYPGLALELNRAIALVAAHEIGHALGMGHYPDWDNDHHVMIKSMSVPFGNSASFSIYGRFSLKTLNGDYDLKDWPNDGMNTRNILGIDCVNSMHEGS